MSRPILANFKTHKPTPKDLYIGRPGPWGNPFLIGHDGTRDDVVDKFEDWLLNSSEPKAQWIRDNIELLYGRTLVCYCSPDRCHGEVLIEYLVLTELKKCSSV